MNPLTRDLLQGSFVWPNALINEMGPLPNAPQGQLATPDGLINKADQNKLLQNGLLDMIYSYGPNPARITTQTQNNIPNKVQRIIAKLFVPAAQTGAGTYEDPILEHATNDGDLVFSLKINKQMAEDTQRYVLYPAGYSHGAVKLINLATLNYLLWGLQVGTQIQGGNTMWERFFQQLCKADHQPLLARIRLGLGQSDEVLQEYVWNFISTYVAPFGVQHGFDTQGGQHEGSRTRVVTNAVDYVSSFAIEGKLLKVNNLWKACDVYEDDDLVLALRYVPPRPTAIPFNLSSSSRAHRSENAPAFLGWWCLTPEVLLFKSLIDTPHIHIGRSQKMVTSYANPQFGNDMPHWNARASIGGTPLQMTFEPCYVLSDALFLKRRMLYLRLNEREPETEGPDPQSAVPVAESNPYAPPTSSAYKRPRVNAAAVGGGGGGGGGAPPAAGGPGGGGGGAPSAAGGPAAGGGGGGAPSAAGGGGGGGGAPSAAGGADAAARGVFTSSMFGSGAALRNADAADDDDSDDASDSPSGGAAPPPNRSKALPPPKSSGGAPGRGPSGGASKRAQP